MTIKPEDLILSARKVPPTAEDHEAETDLPERAGHVSKPSMKEQKSNVKPS